MSVEINVFKINFENNINLSSIFENIKTLFNNKIIKNLKFDLKSLNNKCLIIVGETGVGKTKFVRLLINFLQNKNFDYSKYIKHGTQNENDEDIEDHDDLSNTKIASVYKLFYKENNGDYYEFCILDTPGLRDTLSPYKDDEHLDDIYNILMTECAENDFLGVYFLKNSEISRNKKFIQYCLSCYKLLFYEEYVYNLNTHCKRTNIVTSEINLDNPYSLDILLKKEKNKQNDKLITISKEIEPLFQQFYIDEVKNEIIKIDKEIDDSQKQFIECLNIIFGVNNHINKKIKTILNNYNFYKKLRDDFNNLQLKLESINLRFFMYTKVNENENDYDKNIAEYLETLKPYSITVMFMPQSKEDIKRYISTKQYFSAKRLYRFLCLKCFDTSIVPVYNIDNKNIIMNAECCENSKMKVYVECAEVKSTCLCMKESKIKKIIKDAENNNNNEDVQKIMDDILKIRNDHYYKELIKDVDNIKIKSLSSNFHDYIQNKIKHFESYIPITVDRETITQINFSLSYYRIICKVLDEDFDDIEIKIEEIIKNCKGTPTKQKSSETLENKK